MDRPKGLNTVKTYNIMVKKKTKKTIKYIGSFMRGEDYTSRVWTREDMVRTIVYNKLNTKKQIIDYLSDIRIHKDSIKDFMELLNETKEWMKDRETERKDLERKARKVVEDYFK